MGNMKDSGIEWIGMIPEEWDVNRLRYVCSLKTGGTPADKFGINDDENGSPWITAPDMDESYKIKRYSQYITQDAIDLCKYKLFPPKSILLVCIASVGKLGMIEDYCYSNQQITALMPNKKVFPEFLLYYIQSICHKIVEDASSSVVPIINSAYLKDIKVVMPPLSEQQFIADFLDDKVGKIDDILSDLRKQVETLQKYKKSVITKAVTKGLNSDVVMKDSGIDWIGEIPEGWKVIKLKYLGVARNGLTYSPEDQVDENEGYLVMRSSNIQNGKISLEDNVYVNMKIPKNLVLRENDLLICSRNGSRELIGKNALIDKEQAGQTYGAFMCVYRSEYNKFIHYVLNSDLFSYYLGTFLTSTINQLTNANLNSIKIPFTFDVNEQQEIVNYLDNKCAKIDELIKDKEAQIEKMEKYKKSLIYEYVTGKKRVKGAE